ncbi:hypothetical protein CLU81_3553 [Flavobacterium sp. 9]|uniref:hypothetical protein n=1 Tax=Flavobacterium sp. 9 TaxID=2035198 RepID=UPI000C194BA8|nr:hypothetical protein [Flavobacterium sp. 9]PIF32983.1 hypothetical protein CLU81_3553 [Flavobacterium sp. 9]
MGGFFMSYCKAFKTDKLAKKLAMAGRIDILQKEKEIASKVVKTLRLSVRQEVASTSNKLSGEGLRISGAGSQFKNGRLQRIIMKAPYYIFMQNYGFEGKKSNGINQRLKATDVFEKALGSSRILDTLADDISELRLDQVTALIQFKK